jgi:peptide/nickel transport system substrate-binding protein
VESHVTQRLAMAAGLLAAVLWTGCGSPAARKAYVDRVPLPPDTMTARMLEPGAYGGRFVVGQTATAKTFNPIVANEQGSTEVNNLLHVSLTDIDNITQQDVGLIAKSWEFSDGGRTITFHLRRGLRFSDGHPLTSADVRFSFDVVMDDSVPNAIRDGLTDVDPATGRTLKYTYDAPDSLTFRITSPRPSAMMLSSVSAIRVIPKHVLEAPWRAGQFASAYGTDTPPAKLVTSGPWRLAEFVPDQKVVVERNPYWFGVDASGRRLPYLDQVVFLIVKDQNAAALKFHAGELDGLDNVRPEDYAGYTSAQAREAFELHDVGTSLNTNFLWFNLNRAKRDSAGIRSGGPAVGALKFSWFNRPEFRRAVSKAIDREALIRGPFRGYAHKNWGLLTSGNRTWFDSTLAGDDFDPAGSKALLAAIGFRDRNGDGVLEDAAGHALSFSIMTNGDNTVRKDMLTLICDDLAKVGIKAVPAPVEMNALVAHIRNDFQYDACLLGLGAAVPPDPGMYPNLVKSSGLTHYWHVKQPKPSTPEEARLDGLFGQNVGTTDMAERRRTYHEIGTILNQQCWLVWLPTQLMKLPVRSRFGNVEPSILPHRILWNVDRIFVKAPPGAR